MHVLLLVVGVVLFAILVIFALKYHSKSTDNSKSQHDRDQAKKWMIVFASLAGLLLVGFVVAAVLEYRKRGGMGGMGSMGSMDSMKASFACGCSSGSGEKAGFRFY